MFNKRFLMACGALVVILMIALRPNGKSLKIPYPYKMTPLKKQKLEADAVWLGSEFAVVAGQFIDNLQRRLEGSEKPYKIKDFSLNFLGLHRSIQVLRSLEPFPKIIYYMGNSQEASEFKFYLPDHQKIRNNLKIYSSSEFQKQLNGSGFVSNPFESYKKVINLKDPQVQSLELKTDQKATYLATLYALYEMELKELVRLVKENNSRLILVTTPLKLKDPLVENCREPGPKLKAQLSLLQSIAGRGEFEKGYQLGKALLLKHEGIAELYYTHAITSEGTNRFTEALDNFNKAQLYNCNLYGAKPVFNNILRAAADRYNLPLFDFDKYLQEKFITSNDSLKTNKILKKHYKSLIETLEFLTLK